MGKTQTGTNGNGKIQTTKTGRAKEGDFDRARTDRVRDRVARALWH